MPDCDMLERKWLKQLSPGTMLYLNSEPELGFWLVYHVEVQTLPIRWTQLYIDMLGPGMIIRHVSSEASSFFDRWTLAAAAHDAESETR